MASQYSVARQDTLMITAIADLDGDYNDGRAHCNGPLSPSDAYFPIENLHVYARGMYINNAGEVKGTGMIIVNEND